MTNSTLIFIDIDEDFIEISSGRNDPIVLSEVYIDSSKLRDENITNTFIQLESSVLYELIARAYD